MLKSHEQEDRQRLTRSSRTAIKVSEMASEKSTSPANGAAQVVTSETKVGLIERALRIEWLGQMAASLFWIVSVFTYGISSAGDWLQLMAASCWFLANIAALLTSQPD